MSLVTAILVVGAFAAFFVSFLFAPFAVLAVLYGVMIFGGRARAARRRRTATAAPAAPHDKQTTA
jgi:pheromone shutdown protein TraB